MAGKPIASLVLCILGALFIIGGGALTVAAGSAASSILSATNGTYTVNGQNVSGAAAAGAVSGFLGVDGYIGLIAGIIVLVAAILAYMAAPAQIGRVKMFGAVALVFALISLLNAGGFVIGFILALIGSILALIYKGDAARAAKK